MVIQWHPPKIPFMVFFPASCYHHQHYNFIQLNAIISHTLRTLFAWTAQHCHHFDKAGTTSRFMPICTSLSKYCSQRMLSKVWIKGRNYYNFKKTFVRQLFARSLFPGIKNFGFFYLYHYYFILIWPYTNLMQFSFSKLILIGIVTHIVSTADTPLKILPLTLFVINPQEFRFTTAILFEE